MFFNYFFLVGSAVSVLGQNIAKEKCLEYAEIVYQEEDEIFSLRSLSRKKMSTCAIFENPLIVGGVPARSREFPHMAAIGFGPHGESTLNWLCGGSLISDKHVITAAHCTVSQSGPPQRVRLGTISLTEHDDYVQEIIIERFLNHPEYKRPRKYHDIAILFLEKQVEFSAFIRPACLNTEEMILNNRAIATGFGQQAHDIQKFGELLLKVELNIIPKDTCGKYLKFRKAEMPQNITKNMLCAGYLAGGRDTCQGDSGGPLQIILSEPYCMYSIIGVTSFGRFCGMAYSPAIYTKVDQYVPWIEDTIWQ